MGYPPATLSRLIALNSSSTKILLPEHAGIQRGPTQDKPHCPLETHDMGEAVLMSVPLFLPTFSALPQRREHDPAFTFCVLLAFAASLAPPQRPARLPQAEMIGLPNYNSV